MINRLPFPWHDRILCEMSFHCLLIQNHYSKDLNLCYTHKCSYCEKENIQTHFHHIIPISYLREHSYKNLIELCPSCHKKNENKIIELKEKGKYFHRGIKKKRKILRELYDENKDSYIWCKIRCSKEFKLFIRKHLEIDNRIKILIKLKYFDRAKKLKKEIINN